MKYAKMLILFGAILLSGCASSAKYQAALNNWHGRNINDFIAAWGYPDATMQAPDGNQVYIYQQSSVQTFPVYNTPSYTTISNQGNKTVVTQTPSMQTGGGTYQFKCTTWVEFNKQNQIVRTSFRGNDCVAN